MKRSDWGWGNEAKRLGVVGRGENQQMSRLCSTWRAILYKRDACFYLRLSEDATLERGVVAVATTKNKQGW